MFLLLFFIARIALKQKPFSRVVQEIRGKYCKVAPRSTSSYHKVGWLSSYFHACYDEITYFNRGVFPNGYHDMVESSMRGKFCLFFQRQNYVTYVTK